MNQDFKLKELGQIKYFNCRELDNANLVVNAFTARTGGVSRTPFNNLNLSYNVGDEESRVAENRKIILDALGIDYRTAVTAQQVHKDKIALVKKEDKGKGALKYSKGIAQTDALITDIPGIPLLMCYADCVPVFILDPVKKAIALIHSGRRGTELELTLKTLLKMKKIFETNPCSCLAAIFPSIGPCCYSIKEENKIDDYWLNEVKHNGEPIFLQNKSGWSLDLRKANYGQLIEAGLSEKNIFVNRICTADHPELFFSYRRDKGNTG
ncbi:MAG: peptidoglycan editing factor PgeF, partial [Candidatus Caldatribacteriota bacterium]|nr:peptidoglycan editing factor PgeF [Candidatus Caldatribacteriota bacterium]